MNDAELSSILTAAEAALSSGDQVDLRAVGFWGAVAAAKTDPEQGARYGSRIARIDRVAFERWALFRMPVGAGTWAMLVVAALGFGVTAAAYSASEPWNGLLLLGGTAGLLIATHGLAHLAVGALAGIRFTHWFVGSVRRPQPGVKIDYETYLGAPARRRALMHASGAVVTKLVPFLMLGAAWAMEAQAWVWWALSLLGIGQVAADVLWSVKSSDWKKYRREMRLARAGF